MRNRYALVTVSSFLAICLLASLVRSQDKPADSPAGAAAANGAAAAAPAAARETPAAGDNKAPTMDEMMAAWAKYGTPGKEHEIFKSLAGKFNAEVTMSMPGAPTPEKSTGESKAELIFGGRYLHEDFNGSFMGKPFKGAGLWAFDKLKGKYVNLWIDDMSTMVMIAEGTADSSGKVITTMSKCPDPMQGNKEKTIKGVLTVTDNDNHTYEMFESTDGSPEHKCMSIKYTRVK